MLNSIWKDYIIDLGADDVKAYTISTAEGDLVYSGKAYKRPGAASNTIKINDICASYMAGGNLPTPETGEISADIMRTFLVNEAQTGKLIEAVSFVFDWSNDYDFDPDTDVPNAPITGEVDPRQFITLSRYMAGPETATITMKDGTTTTITVFFDLVGDFNDDFDLSFLRGRSGSNVIDLTKYPDAVRVEVGGIVYNVVATCGRYVLYYLNAFGGWDSLVCKGVAQRTDNYTPSTYSKEYDNDKAINRGDVTYLNEIEVAFTLHSGWLQDEQAARMHHLLGSTDVYLYDLQERRAYPAVMTSKQAEYKTYNGEGRQPVAYDITLRLAGSRIRR